MSEWRRWAKVRLLEPQVADERPKETKVGQALQSGGCLAAKFAAHS
jgi:hypothetical protein